MNIFTKIAKVLFSPSQAIPHLSGADWLLPVLLAVVITFVTTLSMYPSVILPMAEQQIDKQMEKMPSNQRGAMEMAKRQMRSPEAQMFQSLIAGIMQGIGLLLIALAVMAGGAIAGGKGAKFTAIFPVVCWASLVGTIETLIRYPIALMKESLFVSFSFAALLDIEALGGPLYTLLNHVNPFSFWWIAIVSAGVSYHYEFGRRKSIIVLLLLGGLWALTSMLFSLMGASFGG